LYITTSVTVRNTGGVTREIKDANMIETGLILSLRGMDSDSGSETVSFLTSSSWRKGRGEERRIEYIIVM
jgi:hypothetical protein